MTGSEIQWVKGFCPNNSGFQFSNLNWAHVPVRTFRVPELVFDIGGPLIIGNAHIVWHEVPIGNASNGLCGGMVYAARDYAEISEVPTQITENPSGEPDPLFHYIVSRLFDSFDDNDVKKYMFLSRPDLSDAVKAFQTINEEWPLIANDIITGHPSTIGIIQVKSTSLQDVGDNHQVLVYGYENTPDFVTLHTYDPNHPNEDVTFTFNNRSIGQPLNVSRSHNQDTPIFGIFRTNYGFISPPVGGIRKVRSPLLRHALPCWMDLSKGIRRIRPDADIISLRSITGL